MTDRHGQDWSDPRSEWSRGASSGGDWSPELWHKRRRMIRRFFFIFVFFAAVLVGVLAGLVLLIVRAAGPAVTPGEALLVVCGLPLALGLVLMLIGGVTFRRFGMPMADIMTAADAVAAGDLSVRVNENVRGDVGILARRFNRMTAELERSEESRRRLTADVAHELRTPLQIIQGNLEGIVDGVYVPDSAHVNATLAETRRLARLVDDLQTLSLAESGRLPLHLQRVAPVDLLYDTVTRYAAVASEQGVILERTDSGDAPEVLVDADRMAQVLSNLVTNALRYTPPGGRISLAAEPYDGNARLIISDTGEGIDADDLPYVFDRFWRGDRARARQGEGGSGLGLAITRRLVLAHGGAISVASTPGAGTTFTIDLPSA